MDNIFSGEIREIVKVLDSFMSRGFVTKREGRYSDCLVYVIKGKTKYSFGDYSFSVSDGDIFYLPKDSIYTMDITTSDKPERYMKFHFITSLDELEKRDNVIDISGIMIKAKILNNLNNNLSSVIIATPLSS